VGVGRISSHGVVGVGRVSDVSDGSGLQLHSSLDKLGVGSMVVVSSTTDSVRRGDKERVGERSSEGNTVAVVLESKSKLDVTTMVVIRVGLGVSSSRAEEGLLSRMSSETAGDGV